MLIIKMNLRNKEIKDIRIYHNDIKVIFSFNEQLIPLNIHFKKKQIKQIYERMIEND